jgi:hypothetical protein
MFSGPVIFFNMASSTVLIQSSTPVSFPKVSVKLTSTNHITWKGVVLLYIRHMKLAGHVDETMVVPPEFITSEKSDQENKKRKVDSQNPAYED